MLALVQRASKFYLPLIALVLLGGCTTPGVPDPDAPVPNLFQRAYFAPFDQVWRAAQLAMGRYQMQVNNMDTGVIETVFVKGFDGWKPPHLADESSAGIRYKITLVLVKGQFNGRAAIRATVKKTAELQRDFFSDSENIPSDGFEEKMILYRIDRELEIDRALQRAQESMSEDGSY